MAGAVIVAFFGYRLVFRRGEPIVGNAFHLPTKSDIEGSVLAGPAIFGIGWGLGGFCPGPALTALGLGAPGTLAFVPAMMLGRWAARLLAQGRSALRKT